ncbi:MAG: phosphotransferase, partial [Deltaproteobacteria bacterium]|nr:phosphotransferase [Deltaproteobacteria bacterium]
VDGSLPEVKAEFGVQDSITPLCREAQRVCGLTGNVGGATLTARLRDGDRNLSVFDCEDAPGLRDWRPLGDLSEHADPALARGLCAGGGAPWYRLDFHARLLDFALAGLADRGIALSGAPEQVRVWPLSCIYRLPCEGGDHWLKATRPGAFVPEGAVMSALAGAFPDLVPAPLAFRDDCALFADFGERLAKDAPVAVAQEMLSRFARMQAEADALLDTPGLQSWRLADLPDALPESRALLGPEPDALLAKARDDVSALSEFGIGDHLVHGDVYWGNAAHGPGTLWIFDWSDAGVGHPFFDPMEAWLGSEPRHRQLRRAYLDVWRERVEADVDAAWAIASRLAPGHHLARNTRLLSCFESWERPTLESDRGFWAGRFRAAYADG